MELSIKVEKGYLRLDILKKTVFLLVSPALQRYRRVLDFDPETGDLLLEGEFLFRDGTTVVEEDPLSLTDRLAWAFDNPLSVIREIQTISLE